MGGEILSKLILIAAMTILGVLSANAQSPPPSIKLWFFKGECTSSYSKKGKPTDDMRAMRGDEINCKGGNLSELANGRKLIQFAGTKGIFGFAGPLLDASTNSQRLIMPIDKIYTMLDDTGLTPQQILSVMRKGKACSRGLRASASSATTT